MVEMEAPPGQNGEGSDGGVRKRGRFESEDEDGEDGDGQEGRKRRSLNYAKEAPAIEGEENAGMISVVYSGEHGSSRAKRPGAECPYMDTINRRVLDFDFEKVCSVSLENFNVYACLVCGKYFQGRGRNSHAYFHALDMSHHVFINLDTESVYCLPDGYEIIDVSLADVQHAVNPHMTPEELAQLDQKGEVHFRALDGKTYLQGIMGMNNLHATDYSNAVIQSLFVVKPFRDFAMLYPRHDTKCALMKRLGELLRKVYNAQAFRAHVSPHEFMQEVVTSSNKQFQILKQSAPDDFLAWLLNTLHKDLEDEKGNSKISRIFRGEIEVTSIKEQIRRDDATPQGKSFDDQQTNNVVTKRKTRVFPFFFLSLDLPAQPLFKDAMDRKLLPQIPLHTLLSKFNGVKEHHVLKTGERRIYRLKKLPRFLIMNIKRFAKNNFFVEKNPTIVQFPVKNLEMKEFVAESALKKQPATKYDLVAAITHEGEAQNGIYNVCVKHPPSEVWFELQVGCAPVNIGQIEKEKRSSRLARMSSPVVQAEAKPISSPVSDFNKSLADRS